MNEVILLTQMIFQIALGMYTEPDAHLLETSVAKTTNLPLVCHDGARRVFNGFFDGNIATWSGRGESKGWRFRNTKTKRMNTVYAENCNF